MQTIYYIFFAYEMVFYIMKNIITNVLLPYKQYEKILCPSIL